MPSLIRMTIGVGLVALSYYLGKQVGYLQRAQDELKEQADLSTPDDSDPNNPDDPVT